MHCALLYTAACTTPPPSCDVFDGHIHSPHTPHCDENSAHMMQNSSIKVQMREESRTICAKMNMPRVQSSLLAALAAAAAVARRHRCRTRCSAPLSAPPPRSPTPAHTRTHSYALLDDTIYTAYNTRTSRFSLAGNRKCRRICTRRRCTRQGRPLGSPAAPRRRAPPRTRTPTTTPPQHTTTGQCGGAWIQCEK